MGVLNVKSLQVMTTFVQLVESCDLLLPCIDLLLKDSLSILKVSLLKDNNIKLFSKNSTAVIGFGKLVSPLLVAINISSVEGRWLVVLDDGAISDNIADVVVVLLEGVSDFKTLMVVCFSHHVGLSSLTHMLGKSLNYLILAWHVHLRQNLFQFRFDLCQLCILFSNFNVLLLDQEFEVLAFV
jgi:hypothetical protein